MDLGKGWSYNTVPNINEKFEVVAISCINGVLMTEKGIGYSTDDGWQVGNNWDVLCWK